MKQMSTLLLVFSVINSEAAFTKHYKGITLSVEDGDILTQNVDVIVNSANETCLGGGGIDGIITREGAIPLSKARNALTYKPRFDGKPKKCPTGDARLTVSGDIHTKYNVPYILHAVGPNCESGAEMCPGATPRIFNIPCVDSLQNAFLNSLKTADDFNTYLMTGDDKGHTEFAAVAQVHTKPITSLAFPPISGSIFKCQDFVARSAINAVQKFIHTRSNGTITQIKFVIQDPAIRAQLVAEIQHL